LRLTFSKVARVFRKSADFFKFRTTLAKAGRKYKMRSDFENFRLEFPVSVRLFRMLDRFFEFRPTFPIAGQLLPKRSGNCEFPSDFGKSCPEIVISVRLSPKRSDTLRGIARRSGLPSFFESRGYVAVSAATLAGVFTLDDHADDARKGRLVNAGAGTNKNRRQRTPTVVALISESFQLRNLSGCRGESAVPPVGI